MKAAIRTLNLAPCPTYSLCRHLTCTAWSLTSRKIEYAPRSSGRKSTTSRTRSHSLPAAVRAAMSACAFLLGELRVPAAPIRIRPFRPLAGSCRGLWRKPSRPPSPTAVRKHVHLGSIFGRCSTRSRRRARRWHVLRILSSLANGRNGLIRIDTAGTSGSLEYSPLSSITSGVKRGGQKRTHECSGQRADSGGTRGRASGARCRLDGATARPAMTQTFSRGWRFAGSPSCCRPGRRRRRSRHCRGGAGPDAGFRRSPARH